MTNKAPITAEEEEMYSVSVLLLPQQGIIILIMDRQGNAHTYKHMMAL